MAPRMGRPSLQAQRRLVHALSSRVPMWEEQDHHRILERAGSMPDPVDAAPDHHHDGDGGDDGAGGSPSGGGVGEDYALSATWRRDPRRQLRLLQEALCPLTFTSGDLRPHSQPKARELYETLLQVRSPHTQAGGAHKHGCEYIHTHNTTAHTNTHTLFGALVHAHICTQSSSYTRVHVHTCIRTAAAAVCVAFCTHESTRLPCLLLPNALNCLPRVPRRLHGT
jgi:hypothetical protein